MKTDEKISNYFEGKNNVLETKKVFEKILKSEDFSKESKESIENIKDLFTFAIKNPDLFPHITIKSKPNKCKMTYAHYFRLNYLNKWCKKYFDSFNNKYLDFNLKKDGESDPALSCIIKRNTNYRNRGIKSFLTGHYLFMSAENQNGLILEEFINSVLSKVGWIWCAGEAYKSVDFVKTGKNFILLQVKNKYNTENSSSSKVRDGTPIIKWNRLKQPIKSNGYLPRPNWEKLVEYVNNDNNDSDKKFIKDNLTEQNYLKYIECNKY